MKNTTYSKDIEDNRVVHTDNQNVLLQSASQFVLQEYLKTTYLAKEDLLAFIEGDENYRPHKISDSYINLSIIKRDIEAEKAKIKSATERHNLNAIEEYELSQNNKTEGNKSIELEALFDIDGNNITPKRQLIYGTAGIGKTTLTYKIAYSWAHKESKLWNDKYDYVFWLPLRKLTTLERQGYHSKDGVGLAEFIHYCLDVNDQTLRVKDIQYLLRPNLRDRILLLLDGYDEIVNITDRSLVDKIIDEALSFPNVLMTSRPQAVGYKIEGIFDRKLENIGFTEENIYEYIKKYFVKINPNNNNQSEKLQEKLANFISTNSQMRNICYVPVNLYLLCNIWENIYKKYSQDQNIDSDEIDLSITDLYYEMTNLLMKRYFSRIHGNQNISNVASYEIEEKCQKQYDLLEKLAYRAMTKGESIITVKTIREEKLNSEDLSILKAIGLLKIIGDQVKTIDCDHYFIHLTFQEFFAARYLRKKLTNKNIAEIREAIHFIEENKYSRIYEKVIRFTAGLLIREEYGIGEEEAKQATHAINRFWHIIVNGNVDLLAEKQTSLISGCLVEAKFDTKIHEIEAIKIYVEKYLLNRLEDQSFDPSIFEEVNIIRFINFSSEKDFLEKVVDRFISLLDDSEDKVLESVIGLLGNLEIKDENTLSKIANALIPHLASPVEACGCAAAALNKLQIKDKIILSTIENKIRILLDNESSLVLFNAVYALIIHANYETVLSHAVNKLINLLNDQDLKVSEYAFESFNGFDESIINKITHTLFPLFIGESNKWKTLESLKKVTIDQFFQYFSTHDVTTILDKNSLKNILKLCSDNHSFALTIAPNHVIIHDNKPKRYKIKEDKKKVLEFITNLAESAVEINRENNKACDLIIHQVCGTRLIHGSNNANNSSINSNHSLQYGSYVVSIVRKSEAVSKNSYHAFMVVESKNIHGNYMAFRFDFVNPAGKGTIEIDDDNINVGVENRDKVFQENILGNKNYPQHVFKNNGDFYSITLSISKDQFSNLYQAIKQDQATPPHYDKRGDKATTGWIGKITCSEPGHNCFTWIRQKLKNVLMEEEFQSLNLESWEELAWNNPKNYLTKIEDKKEKLNVYHAYQR